MLELYLLEIRILQESLELEAQEAADAVDGASEESISAVKPESEYKGSGEGAMTSPAKLRLRPKRQPQDGAWCPPHSAW